jgi:hypothetical protein
MKIFIILFLFISIFSNPLFSQIKLIDTVCNCSKASNLRYPKEEYDITGTVIVEFDIDSTFNFSNPIIVQSLGKNFDAEALRVINEQIKFNNTCINACKRKIKYTPKKLRLPITFSGPKDD